MGKVFDKYEYEEIVQREASEQKELEIASYFKADVLLAVPGRFEKDVTVLPHDRSCEEGQIFIDSIEYSLDEEMDEGFLYRRVYDFDEKEAARFRFVDRNTHEDLYDYDGSGNKRSIPEYKKIKSEMKKAKDSNHSDSGIIVGHDNIPYMTIKQLSRTCYGKVKLAFLPDQTMPRKNEITFCDAYVMLLRHDFTRFGVIEFFIPECQDTLHVLEAYRHGRMRIIESDAFDPEYFGASADAHSVVYKQDLFEKELHNINGQTEKEFFEKKDLQFKCYGTKRSTVFAYNKAGEREISEKESLHVLANEEYPKDGTIGESFAELLDRNRSQYSGHKTYASTVSLLEIQELQPDENPSFEARVDYQTSEIFFIEMLLLRDASTSEIKKDIMRIENKITQELISSKEAAAGLEKINKHMSLALQFDGTSYYLWPTVQRSVELLTEDLGIKSIIEKYKENEAILSSMISSLSKKESKKISESQKRYMLILALTSPLNSIANVYKNVFYNLLRPIFNETITKYAIELIDFLPIIISVVVVIAFLRNEKKKE